MIEDQLLFCRFLRSGVVLLFVAGKLIMLDPLPRSTKICYNFVLLHVDCGQEV